MHIFMKFLPHGYPWTRKSPLNFGSNPSAESASGLCVRTLNPDVIHLGRGTQLRIIRGARFSHFKHLLLRFEIRAPQGKTETKFRIC